MRLNARGTTRNYFGGVGSVALLSALAACMGFLPNTSARSRTRAEAQAAGAQTPATEQSGGQAKLRSSSRDTATTRKPAAPQQGQQTFPSAAAATRALVTALQNNDQQALLSVLGPEGKDILSSGDDTADKNDRDQFLQKYQEMHRMVAEPDGSTTLYIGAENWPTPIPLVRMGDAWYFDSAAGKQEVLYRRVGENELTVIQVCHELVDAQKEYYTQPHDGAPAHEYAQTFFSDPGKHNGLYWGASGGPESPIGPLVASAEAEGYVTPAGNQQPEPFHGYYFRILKGQGAVPGKQERSYVVDGKMTGGFAIIAYPAEYRSSGVMTFIVNDGGIVYQKDLGQDTAERAKAMKDYDRDASWHKAD
jgi:Protein of unknown function (DUF2950)